MESLTPTLAAYVAGVLDGEGHIGIHRNGNSYDVRVVVANTAVEWLRGLRDQTECGYINGPRPNGPNPNARPLAQWCLQKPDILWLLPQVLPYLQLKRRQAECVLRYYDERSERSALADEVKALNRRGVYERPHEPRQTVPRRPKGKCAVGICARPAFCRGFCRPHYRQQFDYKRTVVEKRACASCGRMFIGKTRRARCCSLPCRRHMINVQYWARTHPRETE